MPFFLRDGSSRPRPGLRFESREAPPRRTGNAARHFPVFVRFDKPATFKSSEIVKFMLDFCRKKHYHCIVCVKTL